MKLDDKKKTIILALAECNLNVSETANKLYYHRNTVDYHLNQIKKKTNLDPHNFYDLVKLVEMVKGESMND